jgi:hypothetical protein
LNVWNELREICDDSWGSRVCLFDEVIREHPTYNTSFAALDPKHQPRYENLISLIRKEIPHAHLEPSAVPPLAGAPSGSGGH